MALNSYVRAPKTPEEQAAEMDELLNARRKRKEERRKRREGGFREGVSQGARDQFRKERRKLRRALFGR